MENTKDINTQYNQILDKVKEYNSKVEELLDIFDKNTEYYEEKSESTIEKGDILISNIDKLVNKINEIASLNIEDYNSFINTEISGGPDQGYNIDALNTDTIKDIIANYDYNKYLAKSKGYDLKDFTVLGPVKEFSGEIQNSYNLGIILDVDINDNDMIPIEFGFYYQQLNEENKTPGSDFEDINTNPKTIKRYIRGIIFFYNLKDNPKYSIYTIIPENNIFFDNNINIGPEIILDSYINDNKLIVQISDIKPYRIGFKELNDGSIEYYDIFNSDKIGLNDLNIRVDSFFRVLNNSTNINIGGGKISNGVDNECIFESEKLRPVENGFINYKNFNTKNSNIVPKINNKKYSFYTHNIGFNQSSLLDFDIDNILTEMSDYTFKKYGTPYGDKNRIKINSMIVKDTDVFISTTHGIFKYNTELKNTICISENIDDIIGLKIEYTRFNDIGCAAVGFYDNKLVAYYPEKNKLVFGGRYNFDTYSIKDMYGILYTSSGYPAPFQEFFIDNNKLIHCARGAGIRNDTVIRIFDIDNPYEKFISYIPTNEEEKRIFDYTPLTSTSNSLDYKNYNRFLLLGDNKIGFRYYNNIGDYIRVYKYDDMKIEFEQELTESELINRNNFIQYSKNYQNSSDKDFFYKMNDNEYLFISEALTGITSMISYERINDIYSIKDEIENILSNEKRLNELRGNENPIPYKITGNIGIKNHEKLNSIYKEIGSFGFDKNTNFSIYNTPFGFFLVNINDNTKCFWSASTYIFGDTDFSKTIDEGNSFISDTRVPKFNNRKRFENFRFESVEINVGIKSFVGYFSPHENMNPNLEIDGNDPLIKYGVYCGLVFIGNDSEYYYIGFPVQKWNMTYDKENYSTLNFSINPIQLSRDMKFDIIDNYLPSFTHTPMRAEIGYMDDTQPTEQIISDPIKTGFLSNINFLDIPIPLNLELNISDIKTVYTNRNKTFIFTKNKVFCTYENIVYQNEILENAVGYPKEHKKNYFYFMELKLPFSNEKIQKFQMNEFCNFVLTTNGDLYTCGNNSFKEIPVKDSIVYEFTKIDSNVFDFYLSENTLITKKIEDSDDDSTITKYFTVNNIFSQALGISSARSNAKSSFKEIESLRNIDVKDFIRDKDKCFIVDMENNVYACGDNENNLLGISDIDTLDNFIKVYDNTDRNYYFIDIKIRDNVTILRFRDNETQKYKFYITGNFINELFKEFKYYDFGVSDMDCTNLIPTSDQKIYIQSIHNKNTGDNFVKIFKSGNSVIAKGTIEKFVEINSEYYLLINNIIYKYNSNSNELLKVMDRVYDIFDEKEVIKVIKTDLSLGCIVFKDTIEKAEEYTNIQSIYSEHFGDGQQSIRIIIEMTLEEYYPGNIADSNDNNNISPTEKPPLKYNHDYNNSILIRGNILSVEKPDDALDDYFYFKYSTTKDPYLEKTIKIPFNSNIVIDIPLYLNYFVKNERINYICYYMNENGDEINFDIDMENLRLYTAIYSNHASGNLIRDFDEIHCKKIEYETRSLYIEGYYGFNNGNEESRNLCIFKPESLFGYTYPVKNTIKSIKDEQNFFAISPVKRSNEVLPEHYIFDARNDIVASFELEIYPGSIDKIIVNEVNVKSKDNEDEDINKIESVLK